MRKVALLLFILLMLLVVGGSSALAQSGGQQPKISVTAEAGYGDTGAYLIGEWLPIRVTLDNPAGGTAIHARVEVSSRGSDDSITAGVYGRDIDLPASSHKEVTLYAYSGSYTRRFTVQVFDGGNVIATADASADPYEPPSNVIVGVASSDSSLMNILKGEQVGHVINPLPPGGYGGYGGGFFPAPTNGSTTGTVTVAHLSLDDIPTLSQALDSLGVLLLDDVDTGSLSQDQRAAIKGWVSRGGMLITAVRPGGADATAGFADILPVTLSGSRTSASLTSLADLVGTSSPPAGQATIGSAQLRPDVSGTSLVLAQQDGVPLVVERELGAGKVVYLGISPAVSPIKGWDGTVPLLKRILADLSLRISYGGYLRFTPSRGYYSGSLFDTYGDLFAIPGLDLPDPLLVGFFLMLYIVIVGPVNFIILRRMRRAELAWVTVPALVVLFSVAAYIIAFQSKGGDIVAIRANVIRTYPGVEQATFAQHFGLFSPVRRTYTLSLPADSLVTELNAYSSQAAAGVSSPVLGGNPTTIDNVNIDTWSLKAYVAEHTGQAASPVEANLTLGNNEIVGTMKNLSTSPLQDVALVRGDAARYVGYIAPGQQVNVQLAISSGRFDNSSPAALLPPPPGVTPPSVGTTFPYNNGQGNTTEQRDYDRKVELLSAGLYPLLADQPPTDMSVIVVAWGPAAPANFEVPGHTTSTQEINLWTDVVQVGTAPGEQSSLPAGSVPYQVFAPGNNPQVIVWGGGGGLSSVPGSVPTAVPTSAVVPLPTQTTQIVTRNQTIVVPPYPIPSQSQSTQSVRISPYADIDYRLPVGTKPDSLTLAYSIGQISGGKEISALAYNVSSGKWDNLGPMPNNSTLSLPNPAQYAGQAGDVMVRLVPNGDVTLNNAALNMALNQK